MKKYIFVLLLALGCHVEEECQQQKNCFNMISISNAIPVQFWLNGVESYNIKIEPGIEKHCFNQLFNADDEIRVQFTDTEPVTALLVVKDINDTTLESLPFTIVETGVYDITLVPEDYSITNEKIKLEIHLSTLAWEAQVSAANNEWTAVCYAPALGLFIAVAQTGTGNRVMTSPDGITWTTRVSAEDNQWRSVCWSESLGLAVAVSQNGTNRVMTSPDGINWTSESAAEANTWQDVIWVEDDLQFIAVAGTGTNRAMTSPDGSTWTPVDIGAQTWQSITYAEGLYVAVAGTGVIANNIRTSPDATTWTYRTAPATGWAEVVHNGTRFVAVGAEGVMYSDDGITWTAGVEAADHHWTGLAWVDGFFAAVSISGASMISNDGINWITLATPNSNQWASAASTDGLFVAVGLTGTGNRVMTGAFEDDGMVAYSDYLSIKVSHAKTKVLRYSNDTDFAGIIYDTTPVPDFMIRVTAKFFSEGNPEENESEQLSDGSVVKLLGTVKDEKLLEVLPSPFYLHKKLKLILQHNTIYIDNLAWVKEQNYEIQEAEDEQDPLREAKVWLTKQNDSYVMNPFS